MVFVRSGMCVDYDATIACNLNAAIGVLGSLVEVEVTEGEELWIIVDTYVGQGGPGELWLAVDPPAAD